MASQPYQLQSTFDDAGNVLSQTYPTGEVVTTGYSAQGWLTGLSTSQGSTTLLSNAAYRQGANQFGGPAGQMTRASLGNGTYQYSASYDALVRATDLKVTNGSGSTTFFEQARGFDGAGNVKSATTTVPAGTDNQAFCYDAQNRLTWAGATGTPPCGTLTPGTLTAAQYQQSFGYDTLGRLTSGPLGTYVYGSSGHLHAASAIGSAWTGGYDAAGNLTCRAPSGSTTCAGPQTCAQLAYDNQGALAAWQNTPSNPTGTNGFLYDNQGNRVEQQVTQSGTTTTTVYVGNVEQGATSGASTTTTTYYYANGRRIARGARGRVYSMTPLRWHNDACLMKDPQMVRLTEGDDGKVVRAEAARLLWLRGIVMSELSADQLRIVHYGSLPGPSQWVVWVREDLLADTRDG